MSGMIATAATTIDATPQQVWEGLTEPDRIAVWMQGSRVTTNWEVGSPITWDGEFDGSRYQDKGEVLTHDEPHVLSMTHYSPVMGEPDAPENYHTLVYTLTRGDGVTHLELTQDGCADQEQADQFSRSWQQMLDALKAHLEG